MIKNIIEVKDLTFDYDNFRVLNKISIKIKHNTITALVGPNGAGKTTFLRCLAALQKPLFGEIIVYGNNVKGNERNFYQKIGYLSDFFGLYEDLTVVQCLKYAGWSRGLSSDLNSRISYVSSKLNLESLLNNTSQSLSRGQRQRVAIAQSIIHNPKILFLDEPASGLDPEARYELSKLMFDLKKQGMTIVVSSHILAELEDYCDKMVIIKNGVISKEIDVDSTNHEVLSITMNLIKANKKHLEIIKNYKFVVGYNYIENNDQVDIEFKGSSKQQNEMLEYLIENKVPILNFYTKQNSFESIYIENVK